MLKSLGINVDGLEDLTDPEGNLLPDDYNPLGKKIGVFNARRELYQIGINKSGKSQGLYDDADNFTTPLDTWDGEDSWAKLPARCEYGDFDGDGFDEVAVAIYNHDTKELKLRVIDDKSDNYQKYQSSIETVNTTEENPSIIIIGMNIATGDIDGDNNDEILFSCVDYLYIVKKVGTEFKLIKKLTYTNSTSADHMFIYVACGDTDSDGVDEVVVTNGYNDNSVIGKYYIYDEDFNTPIKTGNTSCVTQASQLVQLPCPNVTMGDYDRDGLDEIIFSGTNEDGLRIIMLNDAKGYGRLNSSSYEFSTIIGIVADSSNAFGLSARTLDVDGDGLLEIACFNCLFDDITHIDNGTRYMVLINDDIPVSALSIFYSFKVGDMNNDRREDIVIINGASRPTICIIGFNSSDEFGMLYQIPETGENYANVDICLPNIDDDTAIFEYRNEHEVLFTDPQIQAVLASPPYWKQYNQAIDGSETSFGIMHSQGQSVTNEFGFNVGFSIGYHAETPLWGSAGSSEFKATVENSFDWSSTYSHEIEETFSYITPAGEDMVIFSAIPFDVYYYNIISAPEGADECVGDVVTINIPRTIMTTACERTFYNEHNGDCPDVDKNVLIHTIGKPFTYMTVEDKEALVNQHSSTGILYSSSMMTVGAGSGTQQVEISEVSSSSSGFSYNLDIKAEFEGVGACVLFGASVGFHYGYSMETTIGDGTIISGSVGNLSASDYTVDRAFSWGLISYPLNFQEGYEINVITYWVD